MPCIMCGDWVEWWTVRLRVDGSKSATSPRGSSVTPVWRPKWKVSSTTASASA